MNNFKISQLISLGDKPLSGHKAVTFHRSFCTSRPASVYIRRPEVASQNINCRYPCFFCISPNPNFVLPVRYSRRQKSTNKMTDATKHPLSGLWQPTQLQKLHYGHETVSKYLLACLPTTKSKAFIITGNSLATKTPLVKQVEEILKDRRAGTFSKIGEHAPVAQLDEATQIVENDADVDTVVSIGGGSPIDSAKAISYRLHDKNGTWLYHIAIPTTLSASECTMMAGYTESNGVKTGVRAPELVPNVVLYDSSFALHTPEKLWLSTGMRAMDHAIELLYHPTATEMPARWVCLQAAASLFEKPTKISAELQGPGYHYEASTRCLRVSWVPRGLTSRAA